jgi:signal transduction histidine kinase
MLLWLRRPSAEHRRVLAPVTTRRLLVWFVLTGLTAALVVSYVTARVSRTVAVDVAITDALDQSIEDARVLVEPMLSDAAIEGDPLAVAGLDRAVRNGILSDSLVSVKLWTEDGTIVYSNEPRLIGEQFDLDARESALFHGGDAVAAVSDLSAEENKFETGERLLEVYVPSTTIEGTPLLYESYYRYSGVSAVGRDLSRHFIPIAIGAVLCVELIQIPLALTLARRLRSGQRQRQRLLGHAIAASDAERRRIADGLHFGPLQNLVGSSMSLAAASRSTDGGDVCLDAASAGISESVRSLRSLLVDIAPPDFSSGSLETALEAMLHRLDDHGITTELSFETDGTHVGPSTTRLVYRTAQELVRDALNAGTASVRFELRVQNRTLDFLVGDNRSYANTSDPDDGSNDDAISVLSALTDLIADAGGEMSTAYEGAFGRWTRLEIPLLEESDRLNRLA